jgi:hypothetical protein
MLTTRGIAIASSSNRSDASFVTFLSGYLGLRKGIDLRTQSIMSYAAGLEMKNLIMKGFLSQLR